MLYTVYSVLTAVLGILLYTYSGSCYMKAHISSIKPVGGMALFCSHVKTMFFSPVGKFSKVCGDSLSLRQVCVCKKR